CHDIVAAQFGVGLEDPGDASATGDHAQDVAYHDPRPADHGLTTADIRVGFDARVHHRSRLARLPQRLDRRDWAGARAEFLLARFEQVAAVAVVFDDGGEAFDF